jgi:putative lipoprotein
MPGAEPQRRAGAEERGGRSVVELRPSDNPLGTPLSIIGRTASSLAVRLVLVTAALAVAGCAASAPKEVKPLASLSGTVTYREPIELSPDAIVTVELADVSRQDAAAKVLAEQIISNPGRSPIPFELSYDPDAIVPNHSYAVQARIEWEGRLLFINDTHHCVITRGCPSALEVAVVPVRR